MVQWQVNTIFTLIKKKICFFFFYFWQDNTSFINKQQRRKTHTYWAEQGQQEIRIVGYTPIKKGRMGPYPSLSSGTGIQSDKSEMNARLASPTSDYKKPKYWRADYVLGLIKSSTIAYLISTTNSGKRKTTWK